MRKRKEEPWGILTDDEISKLKGFNQDYVRALEEARGLDQIIKSRELEIDQLKEENKRTAKARDYYIGVVRRIENDVRGEKL